MHVRALRRQACFHDVFASECSYVAADHLFLHASANLHASCAHACTLKCASSVTRCTPAVVCCCDDN